MDNDPQSAHQTKPRPKVKHFLTRIDDSVTVYELDRFDQIQGQVILESIKAALSLLLVQMKTKAKMAEES
mgnify:CR=1 FL=1